MIIVFIIVCLIIAFLIAMMFLILKKTVGIVNSQTKSYFVSKLQGYDDLIQDKENRLNEIDKLIKDKEKGIKDEGTQDDGKQSYAFDSNIIDIFNNTSYQDKNIFELNKRIDENFVVNYEELIKDFLSLCNDKSDYDYCVKLRGKFDSDTIYKLKSTLPDDLESEIKKVLDKEEYKVYDAFKVITSDHSVESFILYLDQLCDLNSPHIKILVGNKSENYDHLSKYIETLYNEKIYRGIKIIYKSKVYDFSLSERNV